MKFVERRISVLFVLMGLFLASAADAAEIVFENIDYNEPVQVMIQTSEGLLKNVTLHKGTGVEKVTFDDSCKYAWQVGDAIKASEFDQYGVEVKDSKNVSFGNPAGRVPKT